MKQRKTRRKVAPWLTDRPETTGDGFPEEFAEFTVEAAMKDYDAELRPVANRPSTAATAAIETTGRRIAMSRAPAVERTESLFVALRGGSTFFAGASTTTNDKIAATTLLSFLLTPDVVAVFKWRGVEPMP